MTKICLIAGAAVLALTGFAGVARAQDNLPDPGNDAARQSRMNDAYHDVHHEGPAERAENATKRDFHEAGHSIHNGLRKTGHAIHHGLQKTGHAIDDGVHDTGHAIHRGADKVTGHP